MNRKRTLIIGGGLAGCLLGWTLEHRGLPVTIWDDKDPFSASKVAAGVINPVSGMRFAKNWNMENFLQQSRSLYQQLEQFFNKQFFFPIPIFRILKDEKEQKIIANRLKDPMYEKYLEMASFQIEGKPIIQINQGGYLRVDSIVDSIQGFFYKKDQWISGKWESGNSKGQRTVFCQGYRGIENPFFSNLPFRLSRGETIDIKVDLELQGLVNTGKWILPWNESEKIFRAGATYEWENLKSPCSKLAQEKILTGIAPLIEGKNIQVLNQKVGIRSNTQNNRPFVARHPKKQNYYLFNGFGSKGVLTIPLSAKILANHLSNGDSIPADFSSCYPMEKPAKRKPLTEIAQNLVAACLKKKQIAIDGTVGNGHDTSFLAKQVGSEGTVLAFDIQLDAIHSSQARLQGSKEEQSVQWFQKGHERIGKVLESLKINEIHAAMFNLGYLPSGDKSILTLPETTQKAMEQSIQYLAINGIISVLVYLGHPGGDQELRVVESLLESLDPKFYKSEVITSKRINPKSEPPVLFILRRIQ